MITKFWKKKKPSIEEAHEVRSALREADKALYIAQARAEEAQHIVERLFRSRQENHYAERIRAAYELETK